MAGDAPSALREALDRHDVEFLREEYPEAIAQAKVGIDQIATIVGAIKHFSQADQGQHEPTDLIDVVKNALELSKSNWSAVADIIFDNDQQLSPIQGNAAALGQVILNLITNAADAIAAKTPDGKGQITLKLSESNEAITLQIIDNGIGIAPENLDRVFDLFFTTKPPGQGTGQGLAVAHTIIIQEHSGTLSVESNGGNGTTFSIGLQTAMKAAA